MVPSDIINPVVDRLVTRCGEAGKAEKLVKDLQALCPGCPVDQIWLLVASFEVFSDSALDVTTHEFHQGAPGNGSTGVDENLARLRAEYEEKISSRSNTGKGPTPPQGRRGVDADGALRAMDEDEVERGEGRSSPPLLGFDPLELTTSNLKRLRKRPGAPKWVRELCKVLLAKVENSEDSYEERSNGDMILEVSRIILSIDKARKAWLKKKLKEERQKRKRKAKKKQKKEQRRAKREAQKLEGGKKKKRSVEDSSDSSSSSSSDSSESSSSSGTSSSDESDRGTAGKGFGNKTYGTSKNE